MYYIHVCNTMFITYSYIYIYKFVHKNSTYLKSLNVCIWTSKQFLFNGIYASPTSGEAYRNRRLTTNFEL